MMKTGMWTEGRENQLKRHIALSIMLIAGVVLLVYSLNVGVIIGGGWFGEDATFLWHMNNYFVIEAQYAYSIFGLAAMAIGGLATGLAMAVFFTFTKTKKHLLLLLAAFFTAIAMSGLGFNTLDFMLGDFYWTNMQYPPPVQIPLLGAVDVWNFYFFFFVMPLWTGGFILGLAAVYYAFVHKPRQTLRYASEKDLRRMPAQTRPEGYVAESKAFSRSRRLSRQAFENTS
jgi:hypothetical protein